MSKLLALVFIILIQGALLKENIAYKRTVTATSIESSDYKADYAVDADGNTRWSSQAYDRQNLIVDLWKVYSVGSVRIAWESAYASQFQVQVSTDYNTWTTVYENYQATGGLLEFIIESLIVSLRSKLIKFMNGLESILLFGVEIFFLQVMM